MKFKLVVDLGSDAMRSYNDILWMLDTLQEQISQRNYLSELPESGDGFKVFDVNGNPVGEWEVSGE